MRGFHCLVRSDVLNELILDPTTAPLYFPQPPPPTFFSPSPFTFIRSRSSSATVKQNAP